MREEKKINIKSYIEANQTFKKTDKLIFGIPGTRTVAFDVKWGGKTSDGEWVANGVTIIDGETKELIRNIYLKSSHPEIPDHPKAESFQRNSYLFKVCLHNKVAVGFNVDNDIKAVPLIEKYALGVQDAQLRYSRIFGQFNNYFQDRRFLSLRDSMTDISREDLAEGPNDPFHDAYMTAILWDYCNLLNLPQDPVINAGIVKKISQIDDRQTCLEFDEIESEANSYKLIESYKREQFKKCKIIRGKDDFDPLILEFGNQYDQELDKVINTSPQRKILVLE